MSVGREEIPPWRPYGKALVRRLLEGELEPADRDVILIDGVEHVLARDRAEADWFDRAERETRRQIDSGALD